jgi:hypothetical protein
MRHFVLNERPTEDQIASVGASVLDAGKAMPRGAGRFCVCFDDAVFSLPPWLEGKEEIKIVEREEAYILPVFKPRNQGPDILIWQNTRDILEELRLQERALTKAEARRHLGWMICMTLILAILLSQLINVCR